DNLFLCDTPSPHVPRTLKVLDFGVAKLLDAHDGELTPLANPTAAGMVVGTPRYFAPEQARGLHLDARADLYAFGLCLYVMLCGRGPFDDCTSFVEVARAHVLRVPAPPSALAAQPVPPQLDDLIARCLAKSPDGRPATAAAIASELAWIQSCA
ncbi:MAG: protein kinase, partial [Deltaproteobacteria bacterium]|nr:protein kinase [Deltaproteobacteria bacterium]